MSNYIITESDMLQSILDNSMELRYHTHAVYGRYQNHLHTLAPAMLRNLQIKKSTV